LGWLRWRWPPRSSLQLSKCVVFFNSGCRI
jgi:hypothetical protein